MLRLDRDSPVALHIQIASYFRAAIANGTLQPGSLLPPELSICETHQVSRTTVRKAMDLLSTEGWVVRHPGKGTYVNNPPPDNLTMIGLLLPALNDPLSIDILIGIEQAAKRDKYLVAFAGTNESLEQEAVDLKTMRSHKLNGYIIFPVSGIDHDAALEVLIAEKNPVVLVDRFLPGLSTDVVVVDNVSGGYQATQHLIELGYTRIGFIASTVLTTTSVRDRYNGYCQALQAAGLPVSDDLLHVDLGDMLAMRAFLTQPNRPQAVFCANDYTAAVAMQQAAAVGLSVPEDLGVVGFDNLPLYTSLGIPLTTIAQSGKQIGERAYTLLREQMSGRTKPKHEVIPVSLVVRDSCGAKLDRMHKDDAKTTPLS